MKSHAFVTLIALFSFFHDPFLAFAQDSEITPHVMIVNPQWQVEGTGDRIRDKIPGVEVHTADEKPDSIMISERDAMLREAGIFEVTRDWRQLDKNLVFLRATYLSSDQMRQRYPGFTPAQLRAVIETANKHDAEHRL